MILKANFSLKTMEARKQRDDIFKLLEKKNNKLSSKNSISRKTTFQK